MFTWHREQDYVFFWVLFNFIAVTAELIARQICTLGAVQSFLKQNLSPQNQLRFQCFLAAPLHCFSMISNYFFIGNGMDIGFVYLHRIFYGKRSLFFSSLTKSLGSRIICMISQFFFIIGKLHKKTKIKN